MRVLLSIEEACHVNQPQGMHVFFVYANIRCVPKYLRRYLVRDCIEIRARINHRFQWGNQWQGAAR
eukprot:COSAG05_NODE_10169_length_579_cov_1.356250_2_plen_65_part_01